jgi:hypothetical protein
VQKCILYVELDVRFSRIDAVKHVKLTPGALLNAESRALSAYLRKIGGAVFKGMPISLVTCRSQVEGHVPWSAAPLSSVGAFR